MGFKGLHNILEPAVFGVLVIIGKNYQKFPEAIQMIENAGVISISNFKELKQILDTLIEDKIERLRLGGLNKSFVEQNKGAIAIITEHIKI